MVLKKAATPDEIVKLGVDGIVSLWKEEKLRANGRSKAIKIVTAATNSIGLRDGLESARLEIRELAGLELVSDDSGKHNGRKRISKRGRCKLRYLLFQAAISVVGKNEEFSEIHHYYTTREKNPLKKMQSLIAVACKLIRVFYAVLTKGTRYDASKMLEDIKRPESRLQAA